MKKIITLFVFFFNFITNNVLANAINDLKNRLDNVGSFHANFTQKVTDSNGNVVQKGSGDVWVKPPNLFRWHMNQPDEIILVSDGKTLWFYNPFLEQATAIWLKDVINNDPFILITNNQIIDWQKYNVKQNGNDFTLIPKSNSDQLKQFAISISRKGTIHKFSTVGQNNRNVSYQFKIQQSSIIDMSKFTFVPPQKVTVDDQR